MERRGRIWFVVQFLLFCAILIAPWFRRPDWPFWVRPLGVVLLACGIVVAVRGYRTLGTSHSPWTDPVSDGRFVSSGVYSYMRHPIYAGWILATLGLELAADSPSGVAVAVALFVFFDLKSREEERWLVATYGDYPSYARRVKRFIPFVY